MNASNNTNKIAWVLADHHAILAESIVISLPTADCSHSLLQLNMPFHERHIKFYESMNNFVKIRKTINFAYGSVRSILVAPDHCWLCPIHYVISTPGIFIGAEPKEFIERMCVLKYFGHTWKQDVVNNNIVWKTPNGAGLSYAHTITSTH